MTAWDFASAFAQLAASEAVAATPPASPGYGSDLQCSDDLTYDMAERDGLDPRLVAESFYRALITPRGSVVDSPAYGIDLRGELSKGQTQVAIDRLRSRIESQAEDDDRIESVNVSIVPEPDGQVLSITIGGQLADSAGPFSLILGLTDAGLLLKEMA